MLLLAVLMSLSATEPGQTDLGACLSENGGMLGSTICYGDDLERKRAEQQAILLRIDQKLQALPADGVRPDEARRELAEAQRHWSEFVDADCMAGEALFGEGNAFNLSRLACDAEHVQTRTAQLLAFEETYLSE